MSDRWAAAISLSRPSDRGDSREEPTRPGDQQPGVVQPVPVLPVVVDRARMPRRRSLPDDIAGITGKNALSLRHETFGEDCDRILDWIRTEMAARHGSRT